MREGATEGWIERERERDPASCIVIGLPQLTAIKVHFVAVHVNKLLHYFNTMNKNYIFFS